MITKTKKEELIKKLKGVSVPLRQRKMYVSRFGLEDGVWKSYAQVGKRFKVTGEAVRLIVVKINNLIGEA